MHGIAKFPKPFKATVRVGHLLGVFVCTLALTLAVIGHSNFAGAALTSLATQTTSHLVGDDGTDPAIGLVLHCAQHSSCAPLMFVQPQWAMPIEFGLIIAVEPDMAVAGRQTAPPYHPPKL